MRLHDLTPRVVALADRVGLRANQSSMLPGYGLSRWLRLFIECHAVPIFMVFTQPHLRGLRAILIPAPTARDSALAGPDLESAASASPATRCATGWRPGQPRPGQPHR